MKWYMDETVYPRLPIVIQNAFVAWHGRRLRRERFGPEHDRITSFLERSETCDPGELREYQDERLVALVAHAYRNVPYYRDVMESKKLTPSDLRSVDDLPKLPLLRKEDVRREGERLFARGESRRSLAPAITSSSTGTPLTVYWDSNVIQMNHACCMRIRRWAGFPFGTPYATMQGRIATPTRQTKPPFWRYNPSWNQLLMSASHLSERSVPHYAEEMRRFGVRALETYPSCAYLMARCMESRGEHLPLTAVITTGEPLLPAERETIEERFQTRVFDAYGQAERVVFSCECEEHRGHHLYEEYGVTEIVNEDGEPVAEGEPGLIVGTGLHNFGAPLLRYVTGDVGERSSRQCSCGRTLPILDGLTARTSDILVAPDGRMVPPITMSWTVRIFKGVVQWQIIQNSLHELTILIVSDSPPTDRECENVRRYIARHLGDGIRVRIERVAEIPRVGRGKTRHVVSHVPIVWGARGAPGQGDEGERAAIRP